MTPEEFLKSREFDLVFGWIDKKTLGKIDFVNERITINLDLEVVDTYVHEWLHNVYPHLSERAIVKKTRKYVNRMTVARIRKLAQKLLRQGG